MLNMVQKQDFNVEEKLRILYDLQIIDSYIDEIKSIIKSIPLQLEAIENEVENIYKKFKEIREDIKGYDKAIQQEKFLIKENEYFIKKYSSKQHKGRNNIEYEPINKEIEFKELEIELCHKKWKKIKYKKNKKNHFYVNYASLYEKKKIYLFKKRKEFDQTLEKQEKKKKILIKITYILAKRIEPHILQIYNRIRSRVKLAVVPIEKGAPRGSFLTIPIQNILNIAQRNRIIIDEHSGRVLIDPVLAEEEHIKIFKFYKSI